MISIENLYYILHQHLLAPLGIQDIMYHMFGSTSPDHLVKGRYRPLENRYGLLVWKVPSCYYCDQEPLTEKVVYQLETVHSYWWTFKLLVNSEHSELKNKILKDTKYSDWYYFFHGFAALDWFSDGKYFDQRAPWTKPYISMNRLCTGDRNYRLNLVARLFDSGIVNHGHVSLHLDTSPGGSVEQDIASEHSKLSREAKNLIAQHISQAMYLDRLGQTDGTISADLGHKEFELWKSGLWHVVAETVFYDHKLHLTEKIFKPIVAQRPFIIAAAPGNLAYLRSYGFKTFDRWIDENYDTIQDPDLRLQAIVCELEKICNLSHDQLHQMHIEMQDVLLYNFQHFYNQFKKNIVDEMVNNFEKCVRIWNNGRVDDKVLPIDKIDFAQVKKLLSQ